MHLLQDVKFLFMTWLTRLVFSSEQPQQPGANGSFSSGFGLFGCPNLKSTSTSLGLIKCSSITYANNTADFDMILLQLE
jgi:hypothetical protein